MENNNMELICLVGAFLIGFILVLIAIPQIVKIAIEKHLFDEIDKRKIHVKLIPALGGVAIFFGFVVSTIVTTDGYSFDSLKYIIASLIFMFFIGLKDDIIGVSARKKLQVQLFSALLLIILGNVRFTSLHGILGIYEVHYVVSVLLSLIIMVFIVNAFNLIDGIDGLASGVAIVGSTAFGIWFYLAGQIQNSIMSFALAGSLAAFFIYNVFGNKNKIFMGDTGSLIIGLVLSVFVIEFNEFNLVKNSQVIINAAPAISLAIIIVPVIDTLRVIVIRIANKKSPFLPDNNHIHHRLLSIYGNHLKVTLIVLAGNVIIIAVAMLLNSTTLNSNYQFLIILIIGIVFSFIPQLIPKTYQNER